MAASLPGLPRGQVKANPPEQYQELSASARYAAVLQ